MKMYRLDKKGSDFFLRKLKLMVETDDYDTKNDWRMGLIKKIANLRNLESMEKNFICSI